MKESCTALVEDLLDSIVAQDVGMSQGIGCDNMTCIVIEFKKWSYFINKLLIKYLQNHSVVRVQLVDEVFLELYDLLFLWTQFELAPFPSALFFLVLRLALVNVHLQFFTFIKVVVDGVVNEESQSFGWWKHVFVWKSPPLLKEVTLGGDRVGLLMILSLPLNFRWLVEWKRLMYWLGRKVSIRSLQLEQRIVNLQARMTREGSDSSAVKEVTPKRGSRYLPAT